MDGYEATQQICARLGDQAPPIVALTAKAFREDRKQALAMGMADYLTKPIQVKQVFEVLRRLVPHAIQSDPEDDDLSATTQPNQTAPSPAVQGPFRFEEVIEVLGGDRPFFLRQLKAFEDSFADLPERLEAFLDQELWEEAVNLVHAAKGAGANLGADGLSASLGDLEQALRHKQKSLAEIVAAKRQFTLLHRAIDGFLIHGSAGQGDVYEQTVDESVEESDRGELQRMVRQLSAKLGDQDMSAVEYWQGLAPLLGTRCSAEQLAQMAQFLGSPAI